MRYIYLLLVDFTETEDNVIVKVGRTNNFDRRKNEYPEDFITVCVIPVENEKYIEKILLKEMRKKYTSRMDIGYEYFEGELKSIYETFRHVIDTNDDEDSEYLYE